MTYAMRSQERNEGPWSPAELERRLRAVGEARYHNHHPFNQRMHRGELERS
jgi:pyrroloquinoline-quinone synthase